MACFGLCIMCKQFQCHSLSTSHLIVIALKSSISICGNDHSAPPPRLREYICDGWMHVKQVCSFFLDRNSSDQLKWIKVQKKKKMWLEVTNEWWTVVIQKNSWDLIHSAACILSDSATGKIRTDIQLDSACVGEAKFKVAGWPFFYANRTAVHEMHVCFCCVWSLKLH